MKSRSEVWLSALDELGALCSVSTERDAISVLRRVEAEGESFFTITLPSFARDLERSLAAGGVPNTAFVGYHRRMAHIYVGYPSGGRKTKKHRVGIPEFLGGFLDIIFNSNWVMSESMYLELSRLEDGLCPPMRTTLDDSDIARMASAIWAVRQLCLMFSKEKDLCSDELIESSINAYTKLDDEMMRPLWTTGNSGSLATVTWIKSVGR